MDSGNSLGVERKIEHGLFLLSVWSKGIAGLVETIGGLLLLFIPKSGLNALVILLTAPELAEDPTDRVATVLQRIVHELTADTKLFVSAYLIIHGVIKVLLVAGLLTRAFGLTRYRSGSWLPSSFIKCIAFSLLTRSGWLRSLLLISWSRS